MITIYEYLYYTQDNTLRVIKKLYDIEEVVSVNDPYDDPEFRYFDRLMREVPRS